MTSLANFLFPAPAERSVGAIWRWWEGRRLPFNLIVGSAGILTLAIGQVVFLFFPDGGGRIVPWQPVVAFGVLANVCYLLGPLAETAIHKLWGRSVLPAGPSLYRMGLTFSVGLALFPILFFLIYAVARILQLFT
jgi:hypothetical protein